jgi:hypothetical protein
VTVAGPHGLGSVPLLILLLVMHSSRLFVVILVLLCPISSGASPRKERAARGPDERVRLFLDCVRTSCDFDYLRTELTFVDWVRSREDADVHVLVTSQRTGSGGTELTLKFIGLGRFVNADQVLLHNTAQTDTSDEVRRGFARMLALGLVRYVATTPDAARLRVVADRPPGEAPVSPGAVDDPWNLWVFRTRIASQLDGEAAVKQSAVSGFFTADRVTEDWKVNISGDGRFSQGTYDLGADQPYTSVSKTLAARALIVKSLADQWSAGVRGTLSSSTYVNQSLVTRIAPAIEYNVFPWAESTRRRLTISYAAGLRHASYIEETIYGFTTETRWDHSVETDLDLKQPWGTINTGVNFFQYFYDLSKYRVGFDNQVDVRLFRGFSLNVNGNAQIIRNQIYLPKGEATPEEILVRRRQLATSYSYYLAVGVSYTFGSIYNNVVNRRFGG